MKKIYTTAFFYLFALGLHAQSVTWADNIACILYTNCTKCHNPNGIAPFSLIDYNDAFNNASAIHDAVTTGYMPPWPPDENYRSFAHERVLPQDQVDAIVAWVNAGAPQGNPANAPTPPSYGSTVISAPDLALQIPTWTLTNNSFDDYRCFVLPTGLSTQAYITAMEFIPGNRNVVHHIVMYQDTSGVPAQNDLNDPGPGYTNFGGTGSPYSKMLGIWVPGEEPYFYPNGMGTVLPANTNIILQMHYPEGFQGQVDSTKVHLELTTNPFTRPVLIEAPLNHDDLNEGALVIPADSIKTFTADYYHGPGDGKMTLLAVGPHMHLIGKSIKSWGVDGQGDTLPFIDIPNWDFHWQGMYRFRQPLPLEENTWLYSEAVYDNTSNNFHNPNTPPQLVTLGEATGDEMMLVFFIFTPYLPGDENIVVDTVFPPPTYLGCNYAISRDEGAVQIPAKTWPNPAGNTLWFSLPEGTHIRSLVLKDNKGAVVRRYDNPALQMELSLAGISNGLYYLTVETENGTVTRKVVVNK